MARRVLRNHLGAVGRGEPLAVAQMFCTVQSERVQRRSYALGERRSSRRVILVVVRHQDRGDAPGHLGDLLEMGAVVGSGVDHDRRVGAHDPRVRPFERVDARVRCEDANDPQHQSCQNVERGMRSTSSFVGSRVSKRSASRSATEEHVARCVSVKYVGQ